MSSIQCTEGQLAVALSSKEIGKWFEIVRNSAAPGDRLSRSFAEGMARAIITQLRVDPLTLYEYADAPGGTARPRGEVLASPGLPSELVASHSRSADEGSPA
jgi:hypothetical protein